MKAEEEYKKIQDMKYAEGLHKKRRIGTWSKAQGQENVKKKKKCETGLDRKLLYSSLHLDLTPAGPDTRHLSPARPSVRYTLLAWPPEPASTRSHRFSSSTLGSLDREPRPGLSQAGKQSRQLPKVPT